MRLHAGAAQRTRQQDTRATTTRSEAQATRAGQGSAADGCDRSPAQRDATCAAPLALRWQSVQRSACVLHSAEHSARPRCARPPQLALLLLQFRAAMALAPAAPLQFRVRHYAPNDAPAVRAFWRRGFLEMPWDITRTLGPVFAGGPETTFRTPRPALAALALAGGARAALALLRNEGRAPTLRAAAAAALGVGGLAALHAVTYVLIGRMCDDACASGDMADIAAHWQLPGHAAFFVAESVADGAVLGSVAVRRGGLRDEAAPPGATLSEPDAASVWKVSTAQAARGSGVARALMAAAEAWAASEGGAQRMVLMTASPGAKRFYARLGYSLASGSTRGTELSVWTKALHSELEKLS